MPHRETIIARVSTRAPREVIAAALERLDGRLASYAQRADFVLNELQRQGYRIKRR
jgi:hypothetical protein